MSFKAMSRYGNSEGMRRALAVVCVAGLLSIAGLGIFSVWAHHQYQEALIYERIAKNVRAEVDDVYESLQEAESSQRGYLLTSKQEYREVFQQVLPEIPAAQRKLRTNIEKLGIDTDEFDKLDAMISRKIEELNLTLVVEDVEGRPQALAIARMEHGESLMNEIRESLGRMDLKVQGLARTHEEFATRYSKNMEIATWVFTSVTILLIGLFGVLVWIEIGRRLRSEKELRAAQDAALAASTAKSQFLAMVSHEIRTPLNGIIGMSDLMRTQTRAEDDRRKSEIIYRSGKALLQIVNQILDFSKIEAGKTQIELSEFSVLENVETTTELFAVKAREKNLTLAMYVDPEIPQSLLGDPGKVSQILRNLISNAIKFTDAGGVIVRARVRFQAGRRIVLRFEIKDSGPGLSSRDQDLLFTAFQQLPGRRAQEGTGLGLSICRGLVEKLGGLMGVDSSVGQGSNFWFELPFKAMGADPVNSELKSLKDKQLVVVGANAVLIELLALYAAELHFQLKFVEGPLGDEPLPDNTVIFSAELLSTPLTRTALLRLLTGETAKSVTDGAPADLPLPKEWKDRLILVADDNETNLILTETMLNQWGLRPHLVRSGKEAIEATTRHDYDLILMDCQMPELDGFEATRFLRNERKPHEKRVRIIALTANASKEDRLKCLEAGMDGVLEKPFDQQQLFSLLRHELPGERRTGIQWSALEELERKTNRAVVDKVVASFLKTLPDGMIEIEKALKNREPRELRRWAHHLRPSAAMIGAIDLSMSCQSVEEAVDRGGDLAVAYEQAAQILLIGQATMIELKSQFNSSPPN